MLNLKKESPPKIDLVKMKAVLDAVTTISFCVFYCMIIFYCEIVIAKSYVSIVDCCMGKYVVMFGAEGFIWSLT